MGQLCCRTENQMLGPQSSGPAVRWEYLAWCSLPKDSEFRCFSDSDSRWYGVLGDVVLKKQASGWWPQRPCVHICDPKDWPAQPPGPGWCPQACHLPRLGQHAGAIPTGDCQGHNILWLLQLPGHWL